jgi:exodeoxyribonuclease V alpha subunit
VITVPDSEITETVLAEYLKYRVPGDVFACQVLTMTKKRSQKNPASAWSLNRVIQEAVNGEGPCLRFGEYIFRVGDKVMLTRNNYDTGYCNGDIGTVKSVSDSGTVVRIEGNDITVSDENLDDLCLSYATTIHKSQGSEYGTVIVALPSEPSLMLQLNLLYTAVTRAKKRVVIVASEGSIEKAVKNKTAAKRNSRLAERLGKENTL